MSMTYPYKEKRFPGITDGKSWTFQADEQTGNRKRFPVFLNGKTVGAGVALAAVLIAGFVTKNNMNQPPASGQGGQGGEIYDDGEPGSDGGTGGGKRSGNLCSWETPAVKSAVEAILGTTACEPPLAQGLTGASWSSQQRTESVTAIVEPQEKGVAPKDLRDPAKSFVQHWQTVDIGTGPDTFCNPSTHNIAIYQDGYVINVSHRDELQRIPDGCSPALGNLAQTVMKSGMVG